jgi:peptide-methionine (S)-S-oxide reductase
MRFAVLKFFSSSASVGLSFIFTVLLYSYSCAQKPENKFNGETMVSHSNQLDTITLGAGCFWCVEAVFQQLKGVHSVVSGYSGGHVENPSYEEICTGNTGHAEVCQVTFDPTVISLSEILEVYWKTHDPTTLNRQGADIGTQYRSVIFYHSVEQQKLAAEIKVALEKEKIWQNPVVTQLVPYENFYKAEDYHQEYYFNNTAQPYCSMVITPKLDKFKKVFSDKLKEK